MKIISVVGARPNFIKIAPIIRAIEKHNSKEVISSHQSPFTIHHILAHTGQHYDYLMSQIFFKELELSEPDIYLGVGPGTHAEQTGRIMVEFEKVLLKDKPDLVMVVGDVNSTLAAAVASVKIHFPVAHVEAGLRSYDKSMPEEINRVLTDAISDYVFTPTKDASENLKREGISEDKIHFVGNVMADSLIYYKSRAEKSPVLSQFSLEKRNFAVVTLHRPSNVDNRDSLINILKILKRISLRIPVIFPVHPRTRKNIESFQLDELAQRKGHLLLVDPMGYLNFVNLMMNSTFVITDSGGVQEETTILNIPCFTWRETTEWKITTTEGTNFIVGNDAQRLMQGILKLLSNGKKREQKVPELWDGKAAERIVKIITEK